MDLSMGLHLTIGVGVSGLVDNNPFVRDIVRAG